MQEAYWRVSSNQCLLGHEGSRIRKRKGLNKRLVNPMGNSHEQRGLCRLVLLCITTAELYTFHFDHPWMWANSRDSVWPWGKWLFLACLSRAMPRDWLAEQHQAPAGLMVGGLGVLVLMRGFGQHTTALVILQLLSHLDHLFGIVYSGNSSFRILNSLCSQGTYKRKITSQHALLPLGGLKWLK